MSDIADPPWPARQDRATRTGLAWSMPLRGGHALAGSHSPHAPMRRKPLLRIGTPTNPNDRFRQLAAISLYAPPPNQDRG